MGEVVVQLTELLERHGEIPEVDDCYLVGIWGDDCAEDEIDEEYGGHPMWKVPWKAAEFPPLQFLRSYPPDNIDEDTWEYQWGGDRCRIGCNTPSWYHPIYLRFRWGDGHPKKAGIEMLVCEKPGMSWAGKWCNHCHSEMDRTPQDCLARRTHALVEAVKAQDWRTIETHIKAIEMWHSETLEEKYKEK